MNFVTPSVELINESDNFKRIERCGRICYKSEDKITDDSAFPFFQRIVKRGHTSVLEHSVVYVRTHNPETYMALIMLITSYAEDTGYPHYIRYSQWDNDHHIYTPVHRELEQPLGFCIGQEHLLSGNIRAWRNLCERYSGEELLADIFFKHPAFADIFKDKWPDGTDNVYTLEDVEIVDSIPTDPKVFPHAYLHNIVTLHITADRGAIDEFARHRAFGHSIESTRYCNYQNGGVTFVFPYWFDKMNDDPKFSSFAGDYANRCYETEMAYQDWMAKCKTPQMARGNLTLWVKSEQAMTGTVQFWIDFLKLRDSVAAHPDAQRIAKMVEKVLVEEVGIEDMWGVKDNGVE